MPRGSALVESIVQFHGSSKSVDLSFRFSDTARQAATGDYVQDVGVLLVSNVRTPIDDSVLESQMKRINGVIHAFAAEFAALVGDPHFATRLDLARARSFITSARLVTDVDFARRLFLQGIQLLDRVATRQ